MSVDHLQTLRQELISHTNQVSSGPFALKASSYFQYRRPQTGGKCSSGNSSEILQELVNDKHSPSE